MSNKVWIAVASSLVVLLLSVASKASSITVDVQFSDRIAGDMVIINRIEQKREKYFRKHRGERRSRGFPKLARARYANAEFAGERLVPDLADFTFETIVRRTVQHSLAEMAPDDMPARISVDLESMRISNYSLARYKSHASIMVGIVSSFDEAGKKTGAVKLTWEMIPRYSPSRAYSGREYAFLLESAHVRIAPLTMGFLEKALEHLYPGKDAPGPVFLGEPG